MYNREHRGEARRIERGRGGKEHEREGRCSSGQWPHEQEPVPSSGGCGALQSRPDLALRPHRATSVAQPVPASRRFLRLTQRGRADPSTRVLPLSLPAGECYSPGTTSPSQCLHLQVPPMGWDTDHIPARLSVYASAFPTGAQARGAGLTFFTSALPLTYTSWDVNVNVD